MNWGFHIKRLRKERHLTQDELSRGSGLTRTHIAQIERGAYLSVKEGTLRGLAKGLDMSLDSLVSEIFRETPRPRETPQEILDRLSLSMPVAVPIYEDYSLHAGEPIEITSHVAIVRERAVGRRLEGYIIHGKCLEPEVKDGDIIIVNRDGAIDNGDMVACLFDDRLYLARLRQIADEVFLENNEGRIRLDDCKIAAPVIEVRRRLK